MNVEWDKQTFKSLEEFWHGSEWSPDISDEHLAMRGRYEEIMCMVKGDRIWPPITSPERTKFNAAFCEVLSRLPQKPFDQVESEMGFVLDDPSMDFLAVNVPAPPSRDGRGKRGIDTIVFFRACLNFEPDALIGLIAHEIAHSFVEGKTYEGDEALVKAKAREWGFGRELDCLERAKEALRGAR